MTIGRYIRTEYQQTSVAKSRSQYLASPPELLFLTAEQVEIGNAALTWTSARGRGAILLSA